MASTEHQILRLRDELGRQQKENERVMALAKQEILEAKAHINWLQSQKAETREQNVTPASESSASSKGGRYFQNGDRTLSNQELAKIMDDPRQSAELFKELESWIASDHEQREAARKAQIRPEEQKWFGNGRVPTADEMANPKTLQEMLKELDRSQ